MKSVFIVYNQALTERVQELLDKANARGFSQWQDVMGRGSINGEPHMGSHTWPAMNSATITIVKDNIAEKLLKGVEEINETAEQQGIRAFVWDVSASVG
ncbi:MAG: PG0541 family transporter-associated protein [Bacteroidota bacterium]